MTTNSNCSAWNYTVTWHVPVNTDDKGGVEFVPCSEDRSLILPSHVDDPREYLRSLFFFDGFEICELSDFASISG